MKTNVFLPTLFITSVIALSSAQGAFAATTASQTVTGTLGPIKQVVTNGGNITATIDETTGALSAALTPAFTLTTNLASTNVRMTSTCNTTTVAQNAFSGSVGNTFLILTNNTQLPLIAQVDDAKNPAPIAAQNGNVIAYGFTPTAAVGELSYTWDNANQYYDGILTHKGGTNTVLTTQTIPKTNTFSTEDVDGTYQATIILSFV